VVVGNGVEAAVRLKHRIRLRRLGWEHAMDPDRDALWARGEPPPRSGCTLTPLIDGAQALPEMARAMQDAKHSVYITGWHISPDFELVRDGERVVLGRLLAELAERVDVRVLVWAGAPLPAPRFATASRRSPARPRSTASPTLASTPFTATTRRRSWSTAKWRSSVGST
jgi:phosphatidylserine/phosphatidylglycerophosphate/cardiolipin synthase-like enzyme